MAECIFCNLKEKKVIDNANFFALYDANPASPGHMIIIPKRHVVSFFELNEEEVVDMHNLLKKAAETIKQKYGATDFNIGINEGELAGRTIHHLHVHIIPRYKGDVENKIGGVRNVIAGKGDYVNKK